MSDSRCKYCGSEIRWVSDQVGGPPAVPRRLALNIVPSPAGSYRVVGAETAMHIPKHLRAASGPLYEPHNKKKNCKGWENAQAMKKRQAADRQHARMLREERDSLPENVTLFPPSRGRNR